MLNLSNENMYELSFEETNEVSGGIACGGLCIFGAFAAAVTVGAAIGSYYNKYK